MQGKLDRSLESGPACRSLKPARRRRAKEASMLVACIIVAFIASGALLLGLGQGTERPEVAPSDSSGLDTRAPPMEYTIWGFTVDSGETALPFCTVTVTNVDKGTFATLESDSIGMYRAKLVEHLGLPYYENGDEILIEAVSGDLTGSVTHIVDDASPLNRVDVVLDVLIPEFPMVIAPVAGIVAIFAFMRFRRKEAEAA